MDSEIKIEIST